MEKGETIEDAAKRELVEESFVTAHELALQGILIFNVPSYPSTMVRTVFLRICGWGAAGEGVVLRSRLCIAL